MYKVIAVEKDGIYVANGDIPAYPLHLLKFERNVIWCGFHNSDPSERWEAVASQFPEFDWQRKLTREEKARMAEAHARCVDGGSYVRRTEIEKQCEEKKERIRFDSWDSLS